LRLPVPATLRAGFSYLAFQATGGGGSSLSASGKASLVAVPLLANGLVGSRTHSLEAGLGATVFFFSGEAQLLFIKIVKNEVLPAATGVLGYRYTPFTSGPMLRIGFTPLLMFADGARFYPWAGLSVGGAV